MINLFDKNLYVVDLYVVKDNLELEEGKIFSNHDWRLKNILENSIVSNRMSLLVQKSIDDNYMVEFLTGIEVPVLKVIYRCKNCLGEVKEGIEVNGVLNSPWFILDYTCDSLKSKYYTSIRRAKNDEVKNYLRTYKNKLEMLKKLEMIKMEGLNNYQVSKKR